MQEGVCAASRHGGWGVGGGCAPVDIYRRQTGSGSSGVVSSSVWGRSVPDGSDRVLKGIRVSAGQLVCGEGAGRIRRYVERVSV